MLTRVHDVSPHDGSDAVKHSLLSQHMQRIALFVCPMIGAEQPQLAIANNTDLDNGAN